MANKKNKVKFGLTNVHYAKIKDWVTDASGANLTPVYVDPVRLPGAVSISIDANGENENFYADDIVYYVISNNSGYEGDLEIVARHAKPKNATRKKEKRPFKRRKNPP